MNIQRNHLFAACAVLLALTLACKVNFGGGDSEAAQTLAALYVEQTMAALQAADAAIAEYTAEPEPTATREIVHSVTPGEPGWVSQYWIETRSNNTTSQKRANGGDFLGANLLERPFSAGDMAYRPDLDLGRVELSQGDTFYYFMLHLQGVQPGGTMLAGWYGVEFDLDRDGRGDVLLWARGDGDTTWNIKEVYVYLDYNNDVGGANPLGANAPNYSGDSYETLTFSPEHLSDPDAAWKRVSPDDNTVMQFAIKKSLLNNQANFMWNAWADDGQANPTQFDYNDFYTLSQAGSPIGGAGDYPLKDLALVDNTCRLPWGFDANGSEPGVCYVPEPTAVPTTPPAAPCNCGDYPNQTFIENEACCVYCGFTWGGTQEFPCY